MVNPYGRSWPADVPGVCPECGSDRGFWHDAEAGELACLQCQCWVRDVDGEEMARLEKVRAKRKGGR